MGDPDSALKCLERWPDSLHRNPAPADSREYECLGKSHERERGLPFRPRCQARDDRLADDVRSAGETPHVALRPVSERRGWHVHDLGRFTQGVERHGESEVGFACQCELPSSAHSSSSRSSSDDCTLRDHIILLQRECDRVRLL